MLQLDRAALQARNQLLALFGLFCLLDIALVIWVQDVWAIGRILPTIGIMYFVMQGRKWAKWLLTGIFGLLLIALIGMVLVLGSQLSTGVIWGSLALAILCLLIPLYMTRSQDLARYFHYQRQSQR